MVIVLSKSDFERTMQKEGITSKNVEEIPDFAVISICSTTNSFCGVTQNHYFKNNLSNVLNIRFDDIETEETGLTLFNEKLAEQIIRFILKHKHKNFIVHCTAGISRSGAVGDFIRTLQNIPYQNFIRYSPQISPNSKVLSILNKVYSEKFNI